MSLLLSLLWRPAEAACPIQPADLAASLSAAEEAVRSEDEAALGLAVRATYRLLPCALFPVPPDLAGRLHIVSGIEAFGRGDMDMARRHFWSAQEIRPGSLELTQRRSLQDLWSDIPGSDPTVALLEPALVDGRRAQAIPMGRPFLEQHLSGATVTASAMRWPDGELDELRAVRQQATWALQDLELGGRFLENRVQGGDRDKAVRLQQVVRGDLAIVRELVRVSEHTLLTTDAEAAAASARRVANQRWREIDGESWTELTGEESELLDFYSWRRRAIDALETATRNARYSARRNQAGTTPLVLSLRLVTAAVYAARVAHAVEHHAERADQLLGATHASPHPSVLPPIGLRDPFTNVVSASVSGPVQSGLIEIDWARSKAPSSALQPVDWGSVR